MYVSEIYRYGILCQIEYIKMNRRTSQLIINYDSKTFSLNHDLLYILMEVIQIFQIMLD